MNYYYEFIAVILITVAWIWGFEYTFKEGEIFGKPGEWMRAHLSEWITKPTFDCKYCMASVHGTIFYALFLLNYPWWMWIVFCFCVCGTTAIFDNE